MDILTLMRCWLIFVVSSSWFYCKQIKRSLDVGFHVFSEKPLGLYSEDAIEDINAVNSNLEKIFILEFMRRYDELSVYAKQKIEAGYIGNPFLV